MLLPSLSKVYCIVHVILSVSGWPLISGFLHVCIGARKGGFLGAISGLGKGAVGLFLRPATGLLDLTSATLTVVQK